MRPHFTRLVYLLVILSSALVFSMTGCCGSFGNECAKAGYRISRKQAAQLVLPIDVFPEGWTADGRAYVDPELMMDIYDNAGLLLRQNFSPPVRTHYSAGAIQLIALHANPVCAQKEMESHLRTSSIQWAPLASRGYTSPIADEFKISAMFPYRYEGTTTASSILRVLVVARYGTIISEVSINAPIDSITVDDLIEIFTEIDERFAANRELWMSD